MHTLLADPDEVVEAHTRAELLAAELRQQAAVFVAMMRECGDLAAEIADLEAQRRAALNIAGQRDPRPDARELCAEVAHGYLSALRPHIPHVTPQAAERAAEELTGG